ncbi:MAG: phosphatidate cytidylyltransferase [Burkholderiales bacterium]
MLGRRLLTAAILIPLALAGLFLCSNRVWGWAAGGAIIVAAYEWGRLARWRAFGRSLFIVVVALSLLLLLSAEPELLLVRPWIWAAAASLWIFVVMPWLVRQWHPKSPWIWSAAGWWVLVPAWLAAYALQRHPAQLLAVMAIVWIADTGAYFAGRRFGRRKLAPSISPGKTWEGVVGATVCVVLYCTVLHAVRPGLLPGPSFAVVVALGLGLLLLSIVGDLFESWMKREAGVKDSGGILPGHGGILDRIDSLTASLPAAALAIHLAGR